ncbi:type III secretion system cytoplasmic ring protein SctQ [Ramlibacter sp. MAHUQ-53]|uniref:type III secretion system cytoplasmic ring protein SctQ n=1 Tax=unclassified Ramlibacter TaxID=2617605 RepID=UPI003624BDA5
MKHDILDLMPAALSAPAIATEWPRLTRQEALARTALAQRAHAHAVQWGGREWTLRFVPLMEPWQSEPDDSEWRIRLQWGGAPFELAVPASAAQAWVQACHPALEVPALPDAFVTPLLEAAGSQVMQALEALRKGQVTIDAVVRGGKRPAELRHVFLIEAAHDESVIHARLATSSLGLMLAAGLVARLPSVRNELAVDSLPVRLRAEIGRSGLTVEEFAQLRPGDAVLLQHPFLTAAGEFWLSAGEAGLRVRCEGAGLVVVQPFMQGGHAMVDEGDISQAGDLDQLPFQVSFDLGQRTMTLAEIRTLQPGQVIDLEQPLASAVNLRVNGVLVGRGELVEIDGRLGVVVGRLIEPERPPEPAEASGEEEASE